MKFSPLYKMSMYSCHDSGFSRFIIPMTKDTFSWRTVRFVVFEGLCFCFCRSEGFQFWWNLFKFLHLPERRAVNLWLMFSQQRCSSFVDISSNTLLKWQVINECLVFLLILPNLWDLLCPSTKLFRGKWKDGFFTFWSCLALNASSAFLRSSIHLSWYLCAKRSNTGVEGLKGNKKMCFSLFTITNTRKEIMKHLSIIVSPPCWDTKNHGRRYFLYLIQWSIFGCRRYFHIVSCSELVLFWCGCQACLNSHLV